MIEIKNLKYSFSDHTLTYPDWRIDNQGHALVLGHSGSGKTTLLHLITGLLKPTEGAITINDQETSGMSAGRIDNFRGRNVGIVFQKPHLIKGLTVAENIRLAGKLGHKKITTEHLEGVMRSLDIIALKNRKVHQISEGQAQRVAIARAVVHEPAILAADEPTASLDDKNAERVVQLLKGQAEACRATLVIATHDQRVKSHFENRLTL